MPDDNDENGFAGLGDMIDEDGNVVTDIDEDDVETPTEEEFEELSPVELRKKYGSVADFYVPDEGEDSI